MAGATTLWWILARVLRDSVRAAASASVGTWLVFTSDAWCPWVLGWMGGTAGRITHLEQIGAIVVVVGAMTAAGWKHRTNAAASGFLNIVGATMCALAMSSALGTHWAIRGEMAKKRTPSAISGGTPGGPDVFHIVLDGYGRTDVFERTYGFSDRAFVEGLRKRGFLVADDARSNYVQTELSLASMLNMSPVQDLLQATGDTLRQRSVLDAMIDDNAVAKALRSRGYRSIALTSGFPALPFTSADLVLGHDVGGTLFANTLLAKTPFPPGSGAAESQFDERRKMLQGVFANLRRLATPGTSPRFVLAHVLAPHPPFVFGARGEPLRPQGAYGLEDGSHFLEHRGTRDAYVEGYRNQSEYIAKLTLEAIDALLAAPGPKPVIVLHGDHGPKAHLDQDSLERTDVNESFPTLLAVHAPDPVLTRIQQHDTLVNVYGAVLGGLFGSRVDRHPDRSYYSTWDAPLAFTDVTGRIDPPLPTGPQQ